MTVLVMGATGNVGGAIVDALGATPPKPRYSML
jgi:uncharacterized protein YbjT (DUF2867 family)